MFCMNSCWMSKWKLWTYGVCWSIGVTASGTLGAGVPLITVLVAAGALKAFGDSPPVAVVKPPGVPAEVAVIGAEKPVYMYGVWK